MHRLEALVHMAIVDDEGEGAQLLRLVARHHGQIRVVPIAQYPEALEIRALRIDLLVGVLAAGGTKCLGIDLLPHPAVRFLHLHLDGQPMAIPAGHIGRIVAVERARLDDDVLEDLVDGMAQVDRPIGVGRSVRQHERRPAFDRIADLLIQADALPGRQHRGLAVRQVCLHGKSRARQVDRIFIVSH